MAQYPDRIMPIIIALHVLTIILLGSNQTILLRRWKEKETVYSLHLVTEDVISHQIKGEINAL